MEEASAGMPEAIADLAAAIVGLLVVEGALYLFSGNWVVAAVDVVLIIILLRTLERTPKGRSGLRSFAAFIGVITLISAALRWPPDWSSLFAVADMAIESALVLVCGDLYLFLRSTTAEQWYGTESAP